MKLILGGGISVARMCFGNQGNRGIVLLLRVVDMHAGLW